LDGLLFPLNAFGPGRDEQIGDFFARQLAICAADHNLNVLVVNVLLSLVLGAILVRSDLLHDVVGGQRATVQAADTGCKR
jgi:hypothetical protein